MENRGCKMKIIKIDKVTIVIKKMKGKTDSFFYEEEIAYIKRKNGDIFSVIANGDIKINIGNDCYNNYNLCDAITKFKLTDKKLALLDKQNKIIWENNNWFEVGVLRKDSEFWEYELGEVAYDYDGAIQLLKNTAFEEEEVAK